MPDAIPGTFIMVFRLVGFSCGSTLEASPAIAPIVLTAAMSACLGSMTCTILP